VSDTDGVRHCVLCGAAVRDVFRGSGGDGSGEWGVRITHVPTGIEVMKRALFKAGENPQAAIDEAGRTLRAELEARLQDA
jgi:protein subunit release factor A